MPTNLKNLLSRPRSRNELKFREREDSSNEGSTGGDNSEEKSEDGGGGGVYMKNTTNNCGNFDDSHLSPQHHHGPSSRGKNFFSCSALPALGLLPDFSPSPNCSFNERSFDVSSRNCENHHGSIRKCKTVLALSRLSSSPTFTVSSSSPSSPVGPGGEFPSCTTTTTEDPSSLSSSRVRMMRDRLYSASSSTLNNLINSSSGRTTKLLSGWKLSKNNPNGGGTTSTSNGTSGSSAKNCEGESFGSSSSGTQGIISPLNSLFSGFRSRSQNSVGGEASSVAFAISSGLSPPCPVTPVNRLRRNFSAVNSSTSNLHSNNSSNNLTVCGSCSRSNSFNSFKDWRGGGGGITGGEAEEKKETQCSVEVHCRLCLSNFNMEDTISMEACSCRYCKDCLIAYVSFEIQEGAYEISCPDANCEKEGVLTLGEIETLVAKSLIDKHNKFRLYREIEKDGQLTWCPSPGCETVCRMEEALEKDLTGVKRSTITCTTCSKTFCADCKLNSHTDLSCESNRRKLVKAGKLVVDESEIYSIKSIKKCPFCHVPIEKDSGCAQMMCKRCKHVFCWYCLTSLDDDFLLRHYDKGPCKNKLGHSRASVVWHRAQVIGIFAGFGVLVLLASPLLILAAPCLLCCRCGYCANKLDPKDPVQL